MTSRRMARSSTASWRAPSYLSLGSSYTCYAQAVRVRCACRAYTCAGARGMRVHVVACGARHEHVYICTAPAWLQVGVGKHQRLHDGDRVEVFNRELLRHRTASTPPPAPHTPPSLVAGRSCPSLTGTPNPNHRTSRSPSASTRTRASRTMSTRDKHSCAHRAQARTRFTSFARCTPRGCRTLSGMHQHMPARAARVWWSTR